MQTNSPPTSSLTDGSSTNKLHLPSTLLAVQVVNTPAQHFPQMVLPVFYRQVVLRHITHLTRFVLFFSI